MTETSLKAGPPAGFYYVESSRVNCAGNLLKFKFIYDQHGPYILTNESGDVWVFWSDFGIRSVEDLLKITVQDLMDLEKEFIKGVVLLDPSAKFSRGLLVPST